MALVGLTQFILWMLLTLILTSIAEGLVMNSPDMMANTFKIHPYRRAYENQLSMAFGGIPLGQLAFAFLFYFLEDTLSIALLLR